MDNILIEKELSLQDKMLYNFIADGLKILFVAPPRYRGLGYLIKTKKAQLSVLDRDSSLGALAQRQGATLINGNIYDTMPLFKEGEFDLVVMDDILLSYQDVELALDYAVGAGKRCLISMTNHARLKNRLSFLFRGTIFDKKEGDGWFDPQFLHICSGGDFLQFCFEKNFAVNRACFYDSALKVQSMYNVLRFPGLMAKKFYFIVSKRQTTS